jgi:hypothetical protein
MTFAALWFTFTGKETNTKITTESQWGVRRLAVVSHV